MSFETLTKLNTVNEGSNEASVRVKYSNKWSLVDHALKRE